MAIALRGSFHVNNSAATNALSPALTGWTTANPQPGDLVALSGFAVTAGVTWSQTAGTGAWTILSSDSNASGLGLTSFCAYRILTGTETTPTFTSTGTAGRNFCSMSAWTPDAGYVIAFDSYSVSSAGAGTSQQAAACTFLSPAGGLSLLMQCAETAAGSSTALSLSSGASGWGTSGLSTAALAGNGTTGSCNLVSAVQLGGLAGTVTPGSCTYSASVIANIYNFLVTEQLLAPRPLMITQQSASRAANW
jgi:hypothetical protein